MIPVFSMWSNAFHQTLEFSFPDSSGAVRCLFGFGVRRIVAQGSGRWVLDTDDEGCIEASLRHGWIAAGGRMIGLCWISDGGRRFRCGLLTFHPEQARWRRLLVRLRVPLSQRLT